MRSNTEIGRLLEVDVVNIFIAKHGMKSAVCRKSEGHSLLVFRHPFFVEFCDYKIENYLEIFLSDMADGLLIAGGSALACSLDLGFQDLVVLRSHSFDEHPLNEIFLSH